MNLAMRQPSFVPTTEDVCLLEELLGKKSEHFYDDICAAEGNRLVVRALLLCARALHFLDEVEPATLEPQLLNDELEAVRSEAVSMIRDITAETNLCVAKLMQLFPTPAIVCPDKPPETIGEFEFDFFDDASTSAANDTTFLPRAHGPEPSVEIALAIGMLSSMLRDDNSRFARRIRAKHDAWDLASELQEFRTRCCKCLQAIVGACLGACMPLNTKQPELPRLRMQGARLAKLRAAFFDLEQRISSLAQEMRDNVEALFGAKSECMRYVSNFLTNESWNDTPLAEKRSFLDFHKRLTDLRSVTYSQLAHEFEGFLRFLELSRNNLESRELIDHDAKALGELLRQLDEHADIRRPLSQARMLLGCDAELDSLFDALENDRPVDHAKLRQTVCRMLSERQSPF